MRFRPRTVGGYETQGKDGGLVGRKMLSTWWAGRCWPGEQEDAGLVGRKIRFLIWTKLWTLHLNEVPTLAVSILGIECEDTKIN